MKTLYTRKCKCCGISFQTNRLDQFYVDRKHQVAYNNKLGSILRRKLAKTNKLIIQTYRIFDQLIGNDSEVRVTKEFLKGKGANISVLTNFVYVNKKNVPALFNILIEHDGEFVKLKKFENGGFRSN